MLTPCHFELSGVGCSTLSLKEFHVRCIMQDFMCMSVILRVMLVCASRRSVLLDWSYFNAGKSLAPSQGNQ